MTTLLLLLGTACSSPQIELSGGTGTGTDTKPGGTGTETGPAPTCADSEPQIATSTISFPARDQGCPWGEGDNGEARNGYFQARVEEVASVELPAASEVCGVEFDFSGSDGGGTPMVYDDVFFLTFDDVVLASSMLALVESFEREDFYRIYDWEAIVGAPLEVGDIPTYCLGEADGSSSCDIPPAEERGNMTLEFGEEIMAGLSDRAVAAGRYDFMLSTLGDNDNTDCSHGLVEFTVDVAYIAP